MTKAAVAEVIPPVDPAVAANATPPADPPIADSAPPPPPPRSEPPAAAAAEDPQSPKQHGNKGKPAWWDGRISEEQHRANREKDRADAAEAELARVRASNNDPDIQVRQQANNADLEIRADQLAEQKLAQRQLQGVISSGVGKYADWEDATKRLDSAGAASAPFAMDVIGVDPQHAHEILYDLSNDLDKAYRLARMTQIDRTRELIRMSEAKKAPIAVAAPASPRRNIQQPPPPPPDIVPSSSQAVNWWDDKTSDADFSKGWEENARKRGLRR